MSCQRKLSWYELIPLVSFITLAGRCKTCKTKISFQYPLVEFISGLVFALLFFKLQDLLIFSTLKFEIAYVYYALMFSLLLVISVYDLKHKIIPDTFSFIFALLAFVGLFFFTNGVFSSLPALSFHLPSILELFGGVFIALPFVFLWFISAGAWMGLGDAKLALGLGWFLGIFRAVSAVAMAFWSGAIIGLCLIVFSKKYGMKSEIPFALYLSIGAFLAFIFNINLFLF
jgi:leader peptidase (prepilin peptidase)/N-methyltransferase